MTVKESVKAFESMLRGIDRYKAPFNNSIEAFLSEYAIDFEPYRVARPKVKGISSSVIIREIREGRW